MENNKENGFIYVPWIVKGTETRINNETVWYSNKWKNLLLKIKHFFIKPKYMKDHQKYMNKMVDSTRYGKINIGNN